MSADRFRVRLMYRARCADSTNSVETAHPQIVATPDRIHSVVDRFVERRSASIIGEPAGDRSDDNHEYCQFSAECRQPPGSCGDRNDDNDNDNHDDHDRAESDHDPACGGENPCNDNDDWRTSGANNYSGSNGADDATTAELQGRRDNQAKRFRAECCLPAEPTSRAGGLQRRCERH